MRGGEITRKKEEPKQKGIETQNPLEGPVMILCKIVCKIEF